jgi:hypothetical protein
MKHLIKRVVFVVIALARISHPAIRGTMAADSPMSPALR